MKIKSIRIIKNEKGASAVEFAIILIPLLMLVFGIFQFGIAYNNYITITHAAREGARLAAVDLYNPDLEDIIKKRAYPIPEEYIIISIITPEGTEIGKPVEVEITYNITIEIPLVGSWDIPLTSKGVMRLEK